MVCFIALSFPPPPSLSPPHSFSLSLQIHAEAHAEEERTKHMVAQHQMTGQFKPPMRGDDRRGRREGRDGRDGRDKVSVYMYRG